MANKLLIDTNLAILLIVGSANRTYIQLHKRLQKFDSLDFDILSKLIGRHDGVLFTPNVLTETSNLVRQISEPRRSEITETMSLVVEQTGEEYVTSRFASTHPSYGRLGLTDAALLRLLSNAVTLLTDDLDLYIAAAQTTPNVINFSHVREQERPDLR